MTKSKIAVLATFASLIAVPAFAGDQNTATELQDSGRYVPQAQLSVLPGNLYGAYASARPVVRGTQVWHSDNAAHDFQLQGR